MRPWALIMGVVLLLGGAIFYYMNKIPLLGYVIPDECWWVLVLLGVIFGGLGLMRK